VSLAYVYFEEEPAGEPATRLMARDEARRIAANIAKLPGRALPNCHARQISCWQ
jgi:hypothetical protein